MSALVFLVIIMVLFLVSRYWDDIVARVQGPNCDHGIPRDSYCVKCWEKRNHHDC